MDTKSWNWRAILGVLLIAAGALFFAQNFLNISLSGYLWAILFAGGGAFFLAALISKPHERWWAAIPGIVLVGLGALIAFEELFPASELGGSLFLASIGLAFLVVYLIRRDYWWAIIPCGTLFTLAIVAGMADTGGMAMPGVLFIGLGVTFGILGLMKVGRESKWPWIPAGILFAIGAIMMMTSSEKVLNYIWPAILILGGLYVLGRSFLKKE